MGGTGGGSGRPWVSKLASLRRFSTFPFVWIQGNRGAWRSSAELRAAGKSVQGISGHLEKGVHTIAANCHGIEKVGQPDKQRSLATSASTGRTPTSESWRRRFVQRPGGLPGLDCIQQRRRAIVQQIEDFSDGAIQIHWPVCAWDRQTLSSRHWRQSNSRWTDVTCPVWGSIDLLCFAALWTGPRAENEAVWCWSEKSRAQRHFCRVESKQEKSIVCHIGWVENSTTAACTACHGVHSKRKGLPETEGTETEGWGLVWWLVVTGRSDSSPPSRGDQNGQG